MDCLAPELPAADSVELDYAQVLPRTGVVDYTRRHYVAGTVQCHCAGYIITESAVTAEVYLPGRRRRTGRQKEVISRSLFVRFFS